jgi:hypothetical protein
MFDNGFTNHQFLKLIPHLKVVEKNMNEIVYLVGGIVMGIMIASYVNQMIKNYVNRK